MQQKICPDNGKVDWKEFIEKGNAFRSEEYSELTEKLVKDKVLSFGPESNYQLTAAGVVTSPSLHMCRLYFTKSSDALEYASKKYGHALYEVEISKVEKVFVPKRR